MKPFAVLAFAAMALAQSSPPAGCSSSAPGTFQITTVNITRPMAKRQLAGVLTLSLQNGILKDQAGRTGYIASNYQFQFDAPVQANARQTSGFSLCSNNTLALGSTAVWYSCNSGGFNNLYSQSIGGQCTDIYIEAVRQGSGGATQVSDGQPQAGTPKPIASQISDGQPQAGTPRPSLVSQITDGQPQAGTPKPVVSQITDGQPQAGTPRPVVSQITDGQPQAGTPRPAMTSRPVVSQISDGQPQAGTPRPVVSQISDGQPQAPTGNLTRPTSPTISTPAQFTGAAAVGQAATGALFAGLFGLVAML